MIRRHRPRQARLSLRLRLASGLLAFAALALPGLAPEAIAQTLRWAAQNDILTLDPHAQNHGTTNAVIQHTYEGLTRDPKAALQAVYKFLGEPWFEHDFDHVEYNADKFDARLGLPGLHTVKPKVSAPKRESVLPPDLFKRFANDSFWRDPKNNIRKVPIV